MTNTQYFCQHYQQTGRHDYFKIDETEEFVIWECHSCEKEMHEERQDQQVSA